MQVVWFACTFEQCWQAHRAWCVVQEVDRLLPGNSHYLCMLSKQWTDITYLPGVSDQEAQQVNTKAMEYSQKVRFSSFALLLFCKN